MYKISSFESKAELLNYLNSCKIEYRLIGQDAEQENAFYVVNTMDSQYQSKYNIGIISEGHGLMPKVIEINNNELIIGFNRSVVAVDWINKELSFSYECETLFFEFLTVKDILIIIFEANVVAIEFTGKKLWQHNCYVIKNYKIENDLLVLEFIDDPPTTISILNGLKV